MFHRKFVYRIWFFPKYGTIGVCAAISIGASTTAAATTARAAFMKFLLAGFRGTWFPVRDRVLRVAPSQTVVARLS
jgi:hypothetical protein